MKTDSNRLTYLVTSANLSPTDHRWLSSLAVFDFEISYRRGEANGDVLSDEQYMRPFLDHLKPLQGDGFACSHESFQAYSVAALGDESAELPAVEVVGARPEAVDNNLPADPTSPQPWHLNLVHNWGRFKGVIQVLQRC